MSWRTQGHEERLQDKALEAILQYCDGEVDQQTGPDARQPHVCKKVRLMDAEEILHGLQLENQAVLDQYVDPVSAIEANGPGVRLLPVLRKRYGRGRWRKLKGHATIQLNDGTVRRAELPWFEAHGIGKRKMRIKRFLD